MTGFFWLYKLAALCLEASVQLHRCVSRTAGLSNTLFTPYYSQSQHVPRTAYGMSVCETQPGIQVISGMKSLGFRLYWLAKREAQSEQATGKTVDIKSTTRAVITAAESVTPVVFLLSSRSGILLCLRSNNYYSGS